MKYAYNVYVADPYPATNKEGEKFWVFARMYVLDGVTCFAFKDREIVVVDQSSIWYNIDEKRPERPLPPILVLGSGRDGANVC